MCFEEQEKHNSLFSTHENIIALNSHAFTAVSNHDQNCKNWRFDTQVWLLPLPMPDFLHLLEFRKSDYIHTRYHSLLLDLVEMWWCSHNWLYILLCFLVLRKEDWFCLWNVTNLGLRKNEYFGFCLRLVHWQWQRKHW